MTSMRCTDTAIKKSMITQEKQDAWIFLAIKHLNVLFLLVERKSGHSVPQNYRNKYWMCTNANSSYFNSSLPNLILHMHTYVCIFTLIMVCVCARKLYLYHVRAVVQLKHLISWTSYRWLWAIRYRQTLNPLKKRASALNRWTMSSVPLIHLKKKLE